MNTAYASVALAPLIPWPWVAGLAAFALALVLFGMFRRARGTALRALVLLLLLGALLNPSLIEEQRRPQQDVAVLVVDDSASQQIGARAEQTEQAVAKLRETLSAMPDLDVRMVRAGAEQLGAGSTESGEGTRLFRSMEQALADVPRARHAGTIMVTDGQVHDAPAGAEAGAAPVHVLLTGRRNEGDRRLSVLQAPTYGIVGSEAEIKLRVDDLPLAPVDTWLGPVKITVSRDGKPMRVNPVFAGRDETLRVPIDHAGQIIVELEAEAGPRELTMINNRAVVVINGVRDRLRVLLVSGQPHAGERVWRNLLKSDPAVDLVHFTILRPPEKQDSTPIRELSLIAFPIRELFETKLYEFDLVVFDQYSRRGVIPQLYLGNVARYVREGGALLEAVGPGFADPYSTLFRTPLGQVLPSEPTGTVFEGGFRPAVTDAGRRHPVTEGLAERAALSQTPWGRWFRQIDAETRTGATLMTGVNDRPLLVLDRVGEGRVGQLLSDHIWLWSRGYEGGGPHGELLRRLAHWLMKEPDLEENALHARIAGDQLIVERRTLEGDDAPITVTLPNGQTQTIALGEAVDGRRTATLSVTSPGLYRVSDGTRVALAAAGPPNPVEFADVRATTERLAPVVSATDGGMVWLADGGVPDLRRVRPGASTAGRGWLGLRTNQDFIVTGVKEIPLLPPLALLLLVGATLVGAWRREAR